MSEVLHNRQCTSEICDLTWASVRGRYGEINYPKGWCWFFDARAPAATYKGCHEKVKAYITVLEWNPTSPMTSQLDSIISFARSLSLVIGMIKFMKTNHRPDDADELERQIKVVVRDSAKKLQDMNNRHGQVEHDEANEGDSDLLSMSSPPSTLCDPTTNTQHFSSGPIRLNVSLLPKAHPDPHYSSNRRHESWASLLWIPLV